jgi:hypothetical protein
LIRRRFPVGVSCWWLRVAALRGGRTGPPPDRSAGQDNQSGELPQREHDSAGLYLRNEPWCFDSSRPVSRANRFLQRGPNAEEICQQDPIIDAGQSILNAIDCDISNDPGCVKSFGILGFQSSLPSGRSMSNFKEQGE